METYEKPRRTFKVGDKVRITKYKNIFAKGRDENWTREIFTVSDINSTNPITYKLVDKDGENIHGSFYPEELQKTEME